MLALAVPALCAGCLDWFRSAREPLRIGINAWPPFELLYLAQEKGFFRDEEVDIDLVDFSSYTGVLRSYHQGNIDGFFATLNEVLIADNFQDLPAVVLVADYSFGGDALVVRDRINSLSELKGKRIAYEESALGSYVLERILEIGGLKPGDVTAINRLPEEGEKDFAEGRADAVITYEPSLGRLLRAGGAKALFTSRDLPGEIVDVMVMRRSVLRDHADDTRRLLRAWFKALAWHEAHPDEAAAIMAKRQNVTVAEFLGSLQGAHIPDLQENRQLMGTSGRPGPLFQTAGRLGDFLARHQLTKRPAGADLLHPDLLDSL
jgi:NitT/TauT family transport system substrate-binding protein